MSDARTLRIGTRGSRLALWQAHHVAGHLQAAWPHLRLETVPFQTMGDRVDDVPLPRIGDRGLFTRDIEDGLRAGDIDLAVHSLKDLPTAASAGLVLGAVLLREDPREALVSASGKALGALERGARIGTSSLRRRAQVLALRPDLEVVDIRGNVPTRIEKVTRGAYDGILLACAGLNRLGLRDRAAEIFDEDTLVPAPGQGALAVQIREDDPELASLMTALDDRPTHLATMSERMVLAALQGGCQAPLGAIATWQPNGALRLRGVVAAVDSSRLLRAEGEARVSDADEALALGARVADDLRGLGADRVLAAAREWVAAVNAGDVA